MKTVFLSTAKAFAAILLINFVLTSCNQAKTANDEAAAQDSINAAQEEAENRARAEALAKDSMEYTHFTSPDLSTFFLHGRVKTMTETEDGATRTFQFDKEGKLIKYKGDDDEPAANKILRDKKRISSLGEPIYASMTVSEFAYDSNGICKVYSVASGHSYTSFTFTSYDENGWPATAKIEGGYLHMGNDMETTGSVSYTYATKDEYGNWTKRVESGKQKTVGSYTEYDPDTEEDVEHEINETEKLSSTIVRTITYYTREEIGL